MTLFPFFLLQCCFSAPKLPDFEDDIFSWVYLDRMSDPCYANFTDFEGSIPGAAAGSAENGTQTITIGERSSATAVASLAGALENDINYTHFYVGFYREREFEANATSSSVVISVKIGDTDVCRIAYGDMINGTLDVDITQSTSVILTIENLGDDSVVVAVPDVALFRYVNIIDNDVVRRSMVMDHMKATQCSLRLDSEFGNLEVETVRLKNMHQIPEKFQSTNMNFRNGEKFSILPILANSEKIIGYNVLDSEVLHFWKIKNVDGMHSFSMRLKPLKSITISYIIIETSSKSYYEALEIWQHSLPLIYNNDFKGSFVSKNGNSVETVIKSFNQKFEKGNDVNENGVKHFYQAPKFEISIPISPENINIGNYSQDFADKCEYIKNYGIKSSQDGVQNYLYNYSNSIYTYYVMFTEEYNKYISNFSTVVSENYDGVFLDNFDNIEIDYNINNVTSYALLENYTLFIPVISSYFNFLTFYYKITSKNYIFEGDWIHPQFASYCICFITYSNMCNNSSNFNFNNSNKQKLWGIKAGIGSKSFSLVENGYAQQHFQELFSVASYLGAFISSSNSDTLSSLLLLNETTNWINLLNEKSKFLLYYQIDFLIEYDGEQNNNSNIDYSLFCKEVDEYQHCYLDLFIPEHENNLIKLSVLKSGSNVFGCFHSPSDVECTTIENHVNITFNNDKLRTVTLTLSIPIEQNDVSWYSVNYGLVILATIPMIALLVCLGFGFWYMFCKKRSSDEKLGRIIKEAKNRRREKKREKSLLRAKCIDDEV